MSERCRIDFWFDPLCPWSWLTSRWIEEARLVREFDLQYHVMSLVVLNEGDLPHQLDDPEMMRKVYAPVRVVAAAEKVRGPEIMGPLYTAIGKRIHHAGNRGFQDVVARDFDVLIADALAEVGLQAELADAAADPSFDEALRRSNDEGMGVPGAGIGTPTIHIDDQAFFGPVVGRLVRGEEAGRLWDAAVTFAAFPEFWEIKRDRGDLEPEFS
ncbi:DsbA family oxidoreductase [Mycolicibacterium vinylchloridicum]|uniref:DsbA family oxidoreductase n=1 Tax=Mycolicibacterium vinylchloridicum TaxID=2736928 RepID=UPI00022E8D83|nr:DsbA family protein [Mycolicibacterium vinylchloridicum]EHB53314.1 DsbA oxidoreductase [Mycolicibacterium rhodesiae JS60]